jgi:hypothetical protein
MYGLANTRTTQQGMNEWSLEFTDNAAGMDGLLLGLNDNIVSDGQTADRLHKQRSSGCLEGLSNPRTTLQGMGEWPLELTDNSAGD